LFLCAGFNSEPRRIVSSFLGDISLAVGKHIKLNAAGICAFTYESFTIVIEVPTSVRSFFLYTEMASLPTNGNHNSNAMMEKMLRLNYLQQETRGGCLSLDSDNKTIFSYTDRVDEIDASDFRNILENFIDSAMKLHTLLSDMSTGGSGGPHEEDDDDDDDSREHNDNNEKSGGDSNNAPTGFQSSESS